MIRKKPLTKLGVYGNNNLRPEKSVESYQEYKLNLKYYKKPKPEWDLARSGLEFQGIQNYRELSEIRKKQELLMAKTIKQNAVNNVRRTEHLAKEQKLLENFTHLDKFVKDSDKTIEKLEKKKEGEEKNKMELEDNVEKLKLDIEELTKFKYILKESVEAIGPFKDVMEGVVESSEYFNTIEDLINKCSVIIMKQQEIMTKNQKNLANIEEVRLKMESSTHDAAKTFADYFHTMEKIKIDYENAHADVSKQEQKLVKYQNFIRDKKLQDHILEDSIYQLYSLLCTRKDEEPFYKKNQIELQSDYIREEIKILEDILRLANIRIQDEQNSLLAQPSCSSN